MGPRTRDRILEVAHELGYRPNMHARALATSCTGTIGAIIHRRHLPLDRSFYGVILEAIEAQVSDQGYHVLFTSLRDGALPRCVAERRVDGLIFLGTDIGPALIIPLQSETAIVVVDHHIPDVESVVADNVRGAFRATEHLLNHGHSRIAFVAETLDDPSFRSRFVGYRRALEQRELWDGNQLVIEGGRRKDSDRVAMQRLLQSDPPSAVFAANDFMAVGAVRALTKAGFRVPRDVAVVGFDDGDLATVIEPPLTSVHVPRAEMGQVAAQRLLERIVSPDLPPELTVLPTTLTLRGSCGCTEPPPSS